MISSSSSSAGAPLNSSSSYRNQYQSQHQPDLVGRSQQQQQSNPGQPPKALSSSTTGVTSSTSTSSLSVHQYIAMIYVYERMIICNLILPICMIFVPIILRILYQILVFFTTMGIHTDYYSKTNATTTTTTTTISIVVLTVVLSHFLSLYITKFQKYLAASSSLQMTRNHNETVPVQQTDDNAKKTNDATIGTTTPHSTTTAKTNASKEAITVEAKVDENSEKENISHNKNCAKKRSSDAHLSTNSNISILKDRHNANNGNDEDILQQQQHQQSVTNNATPTVTQKRKGVVDPEPAVAANTEPIHMNHLFASTTPLFPTTASNWSTMSMIWLHVITFVGLCLFVRSMRYQFYSTGNRSTSNSNNPHLDSDVHAIPTTSHGVFPFSLLVVPTLLSSIQLSICMIIYSSLIGLRYFGPTSIMRASIFPLKSNPVDTVILNWIHKIRTSLFYLSHPDHQQLQPKQENQYNVPNNISAMNEPHFDYNKSGRRYDRPSIHTVLQHVVLSLIASIIISYIGIIPFIHVGLSNADQDDERILMGERTVFMRSAHITAVLLTTLGSLCVVFDGTSHEINPFLYMNENVTKWYRALCNRTSTCVLRTMICVPIISIMLSLWMVSLNGRGVTAIAPYTMLIKLFYQLVRNCAFMSFYIYFIDEMIRTSLFYPRPDIYKMIYPFCYDITTMTNTIPTSVRAQLNALLINSILCDPVLVDRVLRPESLSTSNSILYSGGDTAGLENEELFLCETLMKEMAQTFLTPSKVSLDIAPLEEDVLRIVLLEAFGGGNTSGSGSSNRLQSNPFVLNDRHESIVQEWIDGTNVKNKMNMDGTPIISSFLRGLCVYVGGTGVALSTICPMKSAASSTNGSSSISARQHFFTISQSTLCCIELSIQALARCIIYSFTPSQTTDCSGGSRPFTIVACDWKTSYLSIQLPSIFVAIYNLRFGMIQYIQHIHPEYINNIDNRGESTGSSSYFDYGAYGPVIQTCDSAVLSILQCMKRIKGLGRIIRNSTTVDTTITSQHEYQEWMNHLCDKTTTNNM